MARPEGLEPPTTWFEAKDTETVVNALIKQAHILPRELYSYRPGIVAKS